MVKILRNIFVYISVKLYINAEWTFEIYLLKTEIKDSGVGEIAQQ